MCDFILHTWQYAKILKDKIEHYFCSACSSSDDFQFYFTSHFLWSVFAFLVRLISLVDWLIDQLRPITRANYVSKQILEVVVWYPTQHVTSSHVVCAANYMLNEWSGDSVENLHRLQVDCCGAKQLKYRLRVVLSSDRLTDRHACASLISLFGGREIMRNHVR